MQLGAGLVVAVDRNNDCLRSINRISKLTETFVGVCEKTGSNDDYLTSGTARFSGPWDVIVNNQNTSLLYVTDEYNDAIRLVNIKTKMVSTLVSSSNIDNPKGIIQDKTGNLYVVANHALLKIMPQDGSITIQTLSGSTSTKGFLDSMRRKALYNEPRSVVMLNPTMFLLADHKNNLLRVVDLKTNRTTSVCTGNIGYGSGPIDQCELNKPSSLLIAGTTVYIGEWKGIRKIIGGQYTSSAVNPL